MRRLIIERIKALSKEKERERRLPSDPNELELIRDIGRIVDETLETLIGSGEIKVVGKTLNKHRILRIENNKKKSNE